jgi:hypothetical protein
MLPTDGEESLQRPNLILNTYPHVVLHDTARASNALPDLFGGTVTTKAAKATSTDGHVGNRFVHYLPIGGEGSGGNETIKEEYDDVRRQVESHASTDYSPLGERNLDDSSRLVMAGDREDLGRVGDGIRTRDIQIHNLAP